MVDRRIGVIINGATGRMGTTQHMANLMAIAAEGGLRLRNGDRLVPGRQRRRPSWSARGSKRRVTLNDQSGRRAGRTRRDLHGLHGDRRSPNPRAPGQGGGIEVETFGVRGQVLEWEDTEVGIECFKPLVGREYRLVERRPFLAEIGDDPSVRCHARRAGSSRQAPSFG